MLTTSERLSDRLKYEIVQGNRPRVCEMTFDLVKADNGHAEIKVTLRDENRRILRELASGNVFVGESYTLVDIDRLVELRLG